MYLGVFINIFCYRNQRVSLDECLESQAFVLSYINYLFELMFCLLIHLHFQTLVER